MSKLQHATPVTYPGELRDVVLAHRDEISGEILRQTNRLTERYGRNRDGMLYAAAVGISIGALARDMARMPEYGGEWRIPVPETMIDGKPRADYIEEMVALQASHHRDGHLRNLPGTHALPSRCDACRDLGKLGFPIATDDEVGSEYEDVKLPSAPAVLVIQADIESVRTILRGEKIPDKTPFGVYTGDAYAALLRADREELRDVLFGSVGGAA